MTMLALHDEIRLRYDSLSKRLQQVARYMLDNSTSVAFDTIASIAEQIGVPPSTLIRFASAFGYSGFNEMKQIFRQHLMEETVNYQERAQLFRQTKMNQPLLHSPQDILHVFAQANSQALQQLALLTDSSHLDGAVELLKNANNIYVIGLRRSFSIATYMTYALRHAQRRAFLIDGLGGMYSEQLSMLSADDVVIAISFIPYAEETIELMDLVTKSGARQIVITDSTISPIAKLSDVCFVVKEAHVDGFRSQSASLCLAQTIAVSLAFNHN